MIVSFTGLTRKVLLTGNEKKFVIAIMHIVQTSYRVTTNISENLCQEFITYCSTNDNGDLFCFFKESMVNSVQVQSLCIHEGFLTYNELLTFDNLSISYTLPG